MNSCFFESEMKAIPSLIVLILIKTIIDNAMWFIGDHKWKTHHIKLTIKDGKRMTNIHFVDIGFSNYVEANKILTVNRPDSSPMKRVIQHARENGNFLDLTFGKKTRSIITQKGENGLVVTASAVQPATIVDRIKRTQISKEVVERTEGEIIETTNS